MNTRLHPGMAGGVLLLAVASASGQPCAPAWQVGYGQPGAANANGCACTDSPVYTAIVYDDDGPAGPHQPALYIGGQFAFAGGTAVSNVAKWTGTGWVPVGGVQGQPQAIYPDRVRHLLVINDGSATYPRLYLIGSFTGGDSMVRRLNATTNTWDLVNNANIVGTLPYAAALFDDGSGGGEQLYVGGLQSFFSTSSLGTVAKFNGTAWSAVTPGIGGVYCLKVLDPDGPGLEGPTLFAGTTSGVFQRTGSTWTQMNGVFSGLGVTSLAMFDEDGNGPNPPHLFAAGIFTNMSGVVASNIARWSPGWSAVGTGLTGSASSSLETVMTVLDDGAGGGPALYVGGGFTAAGGVARSGLAKWTGSAWADSAIGAPTPPVAVGDATAVASLSIVQDPLGSAGDTAIVATGKFGAFDNVVTGNIALRRGTQWMALNHGMNNDVQRLAIQQDGLEPGGTVYAGRTAGGGPRVARLRSFGWEDLPSGANGTIFGLASQRFAGDAAPTLVAGGTFANINGQAIAGIARFNGSQWSSLSESWPTVSVFTIEALPAPGFGSPVVVVGGGFTSAGSLTLNGIGAFDGTAWHALGSGFNSDTTRTAVWALTMFDDGSGSGPRLIAGGSFDRAGTTTVNNIAAWDGTNWSALGGGIPAGTVTMPGINAVAVFDDDGDGPNPPRLYIAGSFDVPGSSAKNIARWTGTQWECPFDFPNIGPTSLRVHDVDGPGGATRPVLVVGGSFTSIGSMTVRGLAAFDGVTWTQLPAGVAAPPLAGRGFNPQVNALLSRPPSALGPSRLLVGGRFVSAAGLPSQSFAELSGCPRCPADFDASGAVDPADVARFVQVWLASIVAGTPDGDFDADGSVVPGDVALFVQAWFGAVGAGC